MIREVFIVDKVMRRCAVDKEISEICSSFSETMLQIWLFLGSFRGLQLNRRLHPHKILISVERCHILFFRSF